MRSAASVLVLLLLSVSSICQTGTQPSSAPPAAAKAQADQLISDEWEFEMRSSPETATLLGDHRYDDQVSDPTPQAVKARAADQKRFLDRAKAIDLTKLGEQDALSIKLLVRRLQTQLDWLPLEPWLMPVTQMGGPHTWYAELSRQTAFRNADDYDHYIARLAKLPKLVDQVTASMREGMQKHVIPPAFLLTEAAKQAEQIGSAKGEQ